MRAMTGIEKLIELADIASDGYCPPEDEVVCVSYDSCHECWMSYGRKIADQIEREACRNLKVCSSCRYWIRGGDLCRRPDVFTEYGVDILSMRASDFCSKWEAK